MEVLGPGNMHGSSSNTVQLAKNGSRLGYVGAEMFAIMEIKECILPCGCSTFATDSGHRSLLCAKGMNPPVIDGVQSGRDSLREARLRSATEDSLCSSFEGCASACVALIFVLTAKVKPITKAASRSDFPDDLIV